MTDILIVGAGPAGLTAAIYGARAGMKVMVFDKLAYGGQVSLTSEVDNYPGVQGIDFANHLYSHAVSQGAEVRFEAIEALELDGEVKRLSTSGAIYEAHSVILATGATRRMLGVPGEEKFVGRGVSTCATCDAAFFRGKRVAIVGGGDTALNEALFLANNAQHVTLIHRRDSFRAAKAKQAEVRARANIEILLDTTVERIEGIDTVERIRISSPEGSKTLAVGGLFVAIGLQPATSLFAAVLGANAEGYIPAGEDCATAIPGVWVAGDVRQKPLRQVVTAAADGAVAAVAAAEYCNMLKCDSTN